MIIESILEYIRNKNLFPEVEYDEFYENIWMGDSKDLIYTYSIYLDVDSRHYEKANFVAFLETNDPCFFEKLDKTLLKFKEMYDNRKH